MSNRTIVGDPAGDLAGSEVRDGYLQMWLRLDGIRQWAIPLPLVRTLLVIVEQVPSQGALQATPADAPAAADTLALHRVNPALGKGIQIGTAWRDGHRFDTTGSQGVLPRSTELGVSIVNQVAGTHLGQPASLDHGQVARRLDHESLECVFRDSDDVNPAGLQMNGEQRIVTGLAQQAPDIDRE